MVTKIMDSRTKVSPMTLPYYDCSTGHSYADGMINTINSRNREVLRIPDGKPMLTIPLPQDAKPYPAVLTSAGSSISLLVLRDAVKLETFRVP